ncbi:MAG: orotate phosphoribosyltransferase [Acidilobaceae archaeon]
MDECRELARIIESRQALLFGEFTLSSGLKSNYYLDMRRLLGDYKSYRGTLELLASKAESTFKDFDTIVGVATGGIPWAAGLALIMGKSLAYVRLERKGHGTHGVVEGAPPHGKCIVVDDVATTGASLESAVEVLKGHCEVVGVLVIVDRLQGAGERMKRANVRMESVATVEELFECIKSLE